MHLPNISDNIERCTTLRTFLRLHSYFRVLFFSFFIVLFYRNVIEEARSSCPSEMIKKERWTRNSSAENKVGLSGHERKTGCRRERERKKEKTTVDGNRILRPTDQISHCPSMSERIYLRLDEWAVIVATMLPSSRNIKAWNNYNDRVKLSIHSTLFSLGPKQLSTIFSQVGDNIDLISLWLGKKKGKILIGLSLYTSDHIAIFSSISWRLKWFQFRDRSVCDDMLLFAVSKWFRRNSITGDQEDDDDARDGRMIEFVQKSVPVDSSAKLISGERSWVIRCLW